MEIIDEYGLPGQMAAFPFVHFEMKLPEIEESGLFQRVFLHSVRVPEPGYFSGIGRAVQGQRLADADVRFVQGILLPVTVLPLCFAGEAFLCAAAR